MNLCFITQNYPGKHNTTDYAFVKQLVDAIAKEGHNCFVLAPYNITHYRKFSKKTDRYNSGKGCVIVYRPYYLSFSQFHIGRFYPNKWFYKRAISKAFRMLETKPDAIYGHFWDSAYQGYEYAKKYNIPLFVATGESDIKQMFSPKEDKDEFCDYVSGVICVSSKNRDESISLGLTSLEKCKVFPNSINADQFKKLDQKQCREHLGLPDNVFIMAFVGWFNDRKGVVRVSDAIKQIQGEEVYSLFIGKGTLNPDCNNILFKGSVPHDEIPYYLNAADVFVLPTLHEGCCNAVVEAMACGLPIISSNRPFNWDVLNADNSIMVDPENVNEIGEALQNLRDDDERRSRLANGALEMAKNLTIEKRAQGIISFIQSRI